MKVNLDLIKNNKHAGFFPVEKICETFDFIEINIKGDMLLVDHEVYVFNRRLKRRLYCLNQIKRKLLVIDPVIIDGRCFMTNELFREDTYKYEQYSNDLFISHLEFYDYDNKEFFNKVEWLNSWNLSLGFFEIKCHKKTSKFVIFKVCNGQRMKFRFNRYLRDDTGNVIILDSYNKALEYIEEIKIDLLNKKNSDFFADNIEDDAEYLICDAEK